MESQAVRRRVNTIASHFAAAASLNQDISATAAPTHLQLLPMKCSSSLNSIIRRCDNRMLFARQASDSQACFMRKGSTEQKCSSILKSDVRRCDNTMYFARQGSDSKGYFMRQASIKQTISHLGVPSKGTGCSYDSSSNAFSSPLFSRISSMESKIPTVGTVQNTIGGFKSLVPGPDSPKFARPTRETNEPKQPALVHPKFGKPDSGEFKWSPRMDVAESDGKYIVAVELPGFTTNNIRVVVDDQKLTVMGNRSTQLWKMAVPQHDSVSVHHQNETLQGAYQIVWPLPCNANRDSVSAEFADGILQIKIPKV